MTDVSAAIAHYHQLVEQTSGAERTWAYHNWMFVKQGYYSSDELIDLSLQMGFFLENPLTRIRRGTQIEEGATIYSGTTIDGTDVRIGAGSTLDRAIITGSHIHVGRNNVISGDITVDNLSLGDNNIVHEISGNNPQGSIEFGNGNKIRGIKINNQHRSEIVIGHYNELYPGLSINCPFPLGWIRIGHYNSLGRDGGGIVSSAYRFNNRWGGPVLIGSHVETTRGAEVLGFAALGLSLDNLCRIGGGEAEVQQVFRYGRIPELIAFFDRLREVEIETISGDPKISLFGVAKVRRCCLVNMVKVRDDVRVQSAYLKNVWVQERCQIYFSVIAPETELKITRPGCVIENQVINSSLPWETFPMTSQTGGYPESDYPDYETLTQKRFAETSARSST